jgi:hypothetical protein
MIGFKVEGPIDQQDSCIDLVMIILWEHIPQIQLRVNPIRIIKRII